MLSAQAHALALRVHVYTCAFVQVKVDAARFVWLANKNQMYQARFDDRQRQRTVRSPPPTARLAQTHATRKRRVTDTFLALEVRAPCGIH